MLLTFIARSSSLDFSIRAWTNNFGDWVATRSELNVRLYDALTAAGVEILSFNAAQLRMIAASRKKTDRRDAYWIARAFGHGDVPTSGLHPDRRDPRAPYAADASALDLDRSQSPATSSAPPG